MTTGDFYLREVFDGDLPIFYEYQKEPEAVFMAAFTAKDPSDRGAFDAFWARIRASAKVIIRTIVSEDQVVGSVLSYEDEGRPEVSYWIGKEYWGQGLATRALRKFLAEVDTRRPMYARAAKDNIGSLRVLEKCGFTAIREEWGFANARGEQIAELVFVLGAGDPV